MTRIGLISDTHGYLDESVFKYFENCDEIWHAGDFGSRELAERLKKFKPLKGVTGNIDGYDLKADFPDMLIFHCEGVKVCIRHIGGYPGRYAPGVRTILLKECPKLFISGHSHILKIIYDDALGCLHINPGAAGIQGWHKTKTLVRFVIDGPDIKNCEVIELGKR
ncbi:MAG: metallophosphoesterase family protein [Bacteroidota bacterium]|nr:metallophosphoesterase family protein [Bacteroidota bacterium]